MTTTLRPTGPEERLEGGARARKYDVCVNSRPVGRLRLTTDPRSAVPTGRLGDLWIAEADRRRGRATVAALAAEEVLRGWGCRRIELFVPADATPALRLGAALGYTPRAHRMRKELTAPPELPPGSTDRPLDEAAYPGWQKAAQEEFVRVMTAQGEPADRLTELVAASHRLLLPDGVHTPGQSLRVLSHEGTDVGTVWTALDVPDEPGAGYVYDVKVAPEHRGRGHGRTLMGIAERECLAAGRDWLGLNVYADNTVARRLYESLDYRITEHWLWKPLL
ncbi:GNAT family N-acetyltransferase [Streptomyces sp. Ru73]|uniref:GNAT family N-acetyltransferase n=1 Tax=Streptomyces sp. Ru73 TaxID=2080748 RepID=UPI000CDDFD4A|nr:GNAT family N-acetyltransferase [Streptomyces sp. Ru73]POX37925.1 GNAT family N-acetyltransferase [Streptomyces sp. Ru73]